MSLQVNRETMVSAGEFYITKNPRENIKAIRVAASIVVVIYDPDSGFGGMVHMALPDSRMVGNPGDGHLKYVDLALPEFIQEMTTKGFSRDQARIKIVGGSQLFNFGGGGGNILNIGTRNAITARTILTREGLQVEKTETGGNKPRTVVLDMQTGFVQVYHPGETPRYI
jgi:chemotaxis protein CheD